MEILTATINHLNNQPSMAGYNLTQHQTRQAITIAHPAHPHHIILLLYQSEQITIIYIKPTEPEYFNRFTTTTKETIPLSNPDFLEIIINHTHNHFA